MSIKLLNLDFLLILLRVVENNNLHGALELLWVLEVDGKATFAKLVVWLLTSFLKGFDEVGIVLLIFDCFGSLLSDLIGSSRGFNLKINFDVLILSFRF